jgi:ankyrin repeat protein
MLRLPLIIIYTSYLLLGFPSDTMAQSTGAEIPTILLDKYKYLLLTSADSGNYEGVELLLKNGIDPNLTFNDGVTALMFASQGGHIEIVNLLLKNGADVNAIPYDGNTALHAAARSNNDSIAEILILNGAKVNSLNSNGVSPLHLAAGYGYDFLTKLLIYYGANLNLQDNFGNTPLMAAVYFGSGKTSQTLLQNGAFADEPDKVGNTPLMIAAQFNDTILFKLLIDYGAQINIRNKSGANALAIAIKNGSLEVVKKLVEMGAATNELNSKKSYHQLATLTGNTNLISALGKNDTRIYKPQIGTIGIFTSSMQNFNDFYFGGGLSIFELNYNVKISTSFGSRILSKPVLIEQDDIFYQFYEYRRFISFAASRDIVSKRTSNGKLYGINMGISYLYSWANYNYRDAKTIPYSFSGISPTLGMFYKWDKTYLQASGQVLNLLKQRKSTFWLTIVIGTDFDITKPKIISKKINWL